jgi:hypothetical protein
MDELDTDDPRDVTLVANAWQQYQSRILPAAVENPTPAEVDLARLSFYFGALALFGTLSAVLDGARSEEAVEIVRTTLTDEFDAFLADHEADLH